MVLCLYSCGNYTDEPDGVCVKCKGYSDIKDDDSEPCPVNVPVTDTDNGKRTRITTSGGGRMKGMKRCVKCGSEYGVRKTRCECGYEFTDKPTPACSPPPMRGY